MLAPAIPLSAANTGLAFTLPAPLPISYLLELITFTLVPALTYISHTRTRTASTAVLLFWPVYLCGISLWSRTLVVSTSAGTLYSLLALRCVIAGLGLLAFAIEYIGPERESDLKSVVEGGPKESEILIANIYQRWMFSWLTRLMRKGVKTYVTQEGLPALVPADDAAKLGDALQQKLEKQCVELFRLLDIIKKLYNSKSVWKALFAAFGGPYLFAGLLKLCQDGLAFLQPQLLRWLLVYISDYQRARNKGLERPNLFQGFAIIAIMVCKANYPTTLSVVLSDITSSLWLL